MPNYNNQYLTLVAKESGQFQFYISSVNSEYYYSTDEGQTWNTATSATTISVSNGSRVMYKGTLIPNSSNYDGIGRFYITTQFEAEGNPMSLLFGDNFIGQTSLSGKDYVFSKLFLWGSNLTSIQNLKLLATTLSIGCYHSMFARCTSLTTIPEDLLLATTLTSDCYGYMFNGCSYLQSIPSNLLPATTLESGCYYNMFQGCTSLTTAPELPATTLAVSCYNSMFYGCTSLTTAPSLLATTLESGCYAYMFQGCTSLTTVPSLLATTLADSCYQSMFRDCTSLTSIPSGLLPATTLAIQCYTYMFSGCTNLTTAPVLSATTLADRCYYGMFQGCSSLSNITCLATDISATQCTKGWVDGVSNSGTFYKASGMTDWTRSTSGIPINWTVEDYNPQPTTIYRWTATTGYKCSGTTKMSREKKQVSTDGGQTWTDVSPAQYRAALPVIEYNSTDCGYMPPTEYRWVSTDGYACSGTTKMSRVKRQISYDGGTTWEDVSPAQYRAAYPVIEYYSADCGYRTRTTTFDECRGYDKYRITQTQYSEDYGHTWIPISSTATLIEVNASSCGYVGPCIPLDKDYSFNNLDTVVYLYKQNNQIRHLTKNYIDYDNDAYVSSYYTSSDTPLLLNVIGLSLSEESTFDGGRFRYSKTVKFKVKGYADKNMIGDRFHLALKDKNGVKWFVNVDLPARMEYSFYLSDSRCETEFTFKILSEYPTLRYNNSYFNFDSANECKSYGANGVIEMKILEHALCKLDRKTPTLYVDSGYGFETVDYLGKTCQLQETYDGDNITTTLQFNLPFRNSSWFTIEQFPYNKWSIILKDTNNVEYLCGFNYGLQPTYTINASNDKGQTSYVAITMTETSREGIVVTTSYTESSQELNSWVYTKSAESYPQTWECYGNGIARYLVKKEITPFGSDTGRYMALYGYTSQFPNLNIVGTFNETATFNEPSCAVVTCVIGGTVPTDMTFTASSQSQLYTISASCNWNVTNKPSWLTMSRTSGDANTEYTVNFFNTREPQTLGIRGEVVISTGSVTKTIGVIVEQPQPLVWPSPQYFDCLHRYVYFNFDPNCKPTVTQISAGPLFEFVGNQLKVYVPRNSSTSVRRSFLKLEACGREMDAEIFQDKTYEEWKDVSGIICENGTSWSKQQRYTGTTSTTIDVPTDEYRKGTKIMDDDPACA